MEGELPKGSKVVVHSLVGAPEHNGRVGEVVEVVRDKARYRLRLVNAAEVKEISVKYECARPATVEEEREERKRVLMELKPSQLRRWLLSKKVDTGGVSELAELASLAVENGLDAREFHPPAANPPPSSSSPSPTSSPAPSSASTATATAAATAAGNNFLPPGITPEMKRQLDMQASQIEMMSPVMMQEQVRVLRTASLEVLRAQSGQNITATQRDTQVRLFEAMLRSPDLKRLLVRTMRQGSFLDAATIDAADDSTLAAYCQLQYENYRADPSTLRASAPPAVVEAELNRLATTDAVTRRSLLKAQAANMVAGMGSSPSSASSASTPTPAARGSTGAASSSLRQAAAAVQSMSDAEIEANNRMQLEMFDRDPAAFRRMAEAQDPNVRKLSDAQLRSTLQMMASQPAKSTREMLANQQRMMDAASAPSPVESGGDGMMIPPPSDTTTTTANATMQRTALEAAANMTPEQLSNMYKMQRDMFRADPNSIRRQLPPAMQAMSDAQIQTMLDSLADTDPNQLHAIFNQGSRIAAPLMQAYQFVDAKTGGRGKLIAGFVVLLVVAVVGWLLFSLLGLVWHVLSWMLGVAFGGVSPSSSSLSSASSTGAAGAAGGGGWASFWMARRGGMQPPPAQAANPVQPHPQGQQQQHQQQVDVDVGADAAEDARW